MRPAEALGSGLFVLLFGIVAVQRPSRLANRGDERPAWSRPMVARDLPAIRKDTLRVLVLRDPLTWEKRPGAQTGLEWELLKRFAHQRHLPIQAVPVNDPDSMLLLLQRGLGDIMAAQLSPGGWASPFTALTQPYRMVACAVAEARKVRNVPARATTGHPVISRWSPFLDSLRHLTAGDSSWMPVVANATPEELLTRLALGDPTALIANDATAVMEAKRLPLVRFKPRTGPSVPLVFAVRTNASLLLGALNAWLGTAHEQVARKYLISAYDNGLDTRKAMPHFHNLAVVADSISPYDSLFQVHGDSLSWDWRLLAAIAYKESRFDTAAVSCRGAGGLMQLMPATAALMGVDSSDGVDGHIQGASHYLARLDAIWRKEVPRKDQRLKFVLAAYNAGPGHVKDAQRLAAELGLDRDRWDGNVERAIVLLNRPGFFTRPCARSGYCRGQDVYWYVHDVVRIFAWLRARSAA